MCLPPGTMRSRVLSCDLTKLAGAAGVAGVAGEEVAWLKVVLTLLGPVGGPLGLAVSKRWERG